MAGEEGFTREEREQLVLRQQERQEQQPADEGLQMPAGPAYTHAPRDGMLNAHQRATRMTSVQTAVSELMPPTTYDTIQRLRNASTDAERQAPLHHARGHRLMVQGDVAGVLEFDMAGSGFQQFRRDHKGFRGKGRVNLDESTVGTSNAEEISANEKDEKRKTVSFYNRWRFLNWIPGIKTSAQIEEHNRGVDQRNARRRAARDALNERYGERQTVGGQKRQHVRRKDHEQDGKTRTRISMAGPLALGGASNSGDYSIENLRKYMLEMAKNYLEPRILQWDADESAAGRPPEIIPTLPVIIKGHSRGAVASAEGAMMIRKWLLDNYPAYADRIKFELIQYDPVPGTGSASGVNEEVDLTGAAGYAEGEDKMAALGASANTTVVYSLHTDHRLFFTPQLVKGAKRIVLTPFKHSVGLDKMDDAETRQGNAQVAEASKHSASYADARTGEVYRGSGLSDLAEGVFIVDENDTLIHLDNYEQAESVMNRVLARTSGQGDRHAQILRAVKAWFDANRPAADAAPQA
jgi:hypothetical protein